MRAMSFVASSVSVRTHNGESPQRKPAASSANRRFAVRRRAQCGHIAIGRMSARTAIGSHLVIEFGRGRGWDAGGSTWSPVRLALNAGPVRTSGSVREIPSGSSLTLLDAGNPMLETLDGRIRHP